MDTVYALGGLQIGSNFDLQPYMTTTPLPAFFGSATLPSAVELYVNGLKQYSGEVPAGPFELNTAPKHQRCRQCSAELMR